MGSLIFGGLMLGRLISGFISNRSAPIAAARLFATLAVLPLSALK